MKGRGESNLEKKKKTYKNEHVYFLWYFLKVKIL